ncbi:MAG TPA: hypothetical protein VLT90_03785 [Terriglobales bacterium]|nr:hypothetical protein [Terriglobales bacterium]
MKALLLNILPWLGVLAFCTLVFVAWLWVLIVKPEMWLAFVDREYAFYLKKGLLSPSVADRMRQFERGIGLKLLVGFCVLVCIAGDSYIGFRLVSLGLSGGR